jgi:glutamate 5-kinase
MDADVLINLTDIYGLYTKDPRTWPDAELISTVSTISKETEKLGIGLVNYSSTEIQKIMGLKSNHIKQVLGHKSYDEVIYQDNLAITAGSDV